MDKDKEPRSNWGERETDYLISLMKDGGIMSALDGKRFRNADIYATLVPKMSQAGFNRSVSQIRAKWKVLVAQYRKARAANARSGTGRSRFPFYDNLHEILADRPSLALIPLGVESCYQAPEDPFEPCNLEDVPPAMKFVEVTPTWDTHPLASTSTSPPFTSSSTSPSPESSGEGSRSSTPTTLRGMRKAPYLKRIIEIMEENQEKSAAASASQVEEMRRESALQRRWEEVENEKQRKWEEEERKRNKDFQTGLWTSTQMQMMQIMSFFANSTHVPSNPTFAPAPTSLSNPIFTPASNPPSNPTITPTPNPFSNLTFTTHSNPTITPVSKPA